MMFLGSFLARMCDRERTDTVNMDCTSPYPIWVDTSYISLDGKTGLRSSCPCWHLSCLIAMCSHICAAVYCSFSCQCSLCNSDYILKGKILKRYYSLLLNFIIWQSNYSTASQDWYRWGSVCVWEEKADGGKEWGWLLVKPALSKRKCIKELRLYH